MRESSNGIDFGKVLKYVRKYLTSDVPQKWRVRLWQYPKIFKKVMRDFTANTTTGRELVRVAGLSGSGKTTQLVPAVEAYFEKYEKKPVLVAARRFVEYHPFADAIREEYGEEDLRKKTDNFATVMLFLTIRKLIKQGYDIILDVSFLDSKMEEILIKMLRNGKYRTWTTMMVVAPSVAEKFLTGRKWRHTKKTEQEFVRATAEAMEFYVKEWPKMRIVMWNVWSEKPIYDGRFASAMRIWEEYTNETRIPKHDMKKLQRAKIKYLTK